MKFFTDLSLRRQKGFTLIELLVVIAIIGILASIITVSLTSARAKGRDAKRVADIRTIQLALENYYSDNGYYPTNLSTNSIAPTYVSAIPTDPSTNVAYFYTSYTISSGSSLCVSSKPIAYHVGAKMESNETTNPALSQDAQSFDGSIPSTLLRCNVTGSVASFTGKAQDCSGTSDAFTDNCYDQTN
jgi:prepilin-type N-terminal cleavage/methylation domain-containing protein